MFSQLKSTAAFRAVVLIVCAAAIGSCSLNVDVEGASALVKFSGEGQTAPPNTEMPDPLAVLVVNQFGEIVKSVTVNWSIVSGVGTLSANSSLSDDGGIASVKFTTGPNAGPVVVRASAHGVPPLTFSLTVSSS